MVTTLVKLILLALQFADKLASHLAARALLDAGAATAIALNAQQVIANVTNARDAADRVDPDSPRYDPDFAAGVRERFSRDDP